MLRKRILLAIGLAILFGLVTKSQGEEAAAPIEIDTQSGKITVRPTPKAAEPTAQKAAEPIPEPSQAEKMDLEASSDEMLPGEEKRTSFMHIPTDSKLVLTDKKDACVIVLENGKYRSCQPGDAPIDQ